MIKKLRDNKGASLAFALAIFLIATLVSVVLVGITMNNANRVQRQKSQEQANLAISSATRYVQKLFDGCGYYRDEDIGEWVTSYGDSELGKLVEKSDSDDFKNAISKLVGGRNLEWKIESDLDGKELNVQVDCRLDEKGNIIADITKVDENSAKVGQMQLIFIANKFTDENGNQEYTWRYSNIVREKMGTNE